MFGITQGYGGGNLIIQGFSLPPETATDCTLVDCYMFDAPLWDGNDQSPVADHRTQTFITVVISSGPDPYWATIRSSLPDPYWTTATPQ